MDTNKDLVRISSGSKIKILPGLLTGTNKDISSFSNGYK